MTGNPNDLTPAALAVSRTVLLDGRAAHLAEWELEELEHADGRSVPTWNADEWRRS